MKIIINATNIIEDRPLREVERLINLGKAHLPEKLAVSFPGYIPSNLDEKPYRSEITYEDLDELNIFREIDLIEPIPIDHYVDFDEPTKKPKKTKKKL
jgi:hypothetical protein